MYLPIGIQTEIGHALSEVIKKMLFIVSQVLNIPSDLLSVPLPHKSCYALSWAATVN